MGQVHVDSWELPTLKPQSFQSSPTYAHAQQVEVSAWGSSLQVRSKQWAPGQQHTCEKRGLPGAKPPCVKQK